MPKEHVVQAGETLIGIIAELCELSPGDVARRSLHVANARANGLSNPDDIRVDQKLTIFCDPEQIPTESDAEAETEPLEGAAAGVEECFQACWERYLERLRACAKEEEIIREACLRGALEVLRSCLEHCKSSSGGQPDGAEQEPSDQGGSDEHGSIIDPVDKEQWDTKRNASDLARVLMSEASVGNEEERTAVGYTVLNRMKRNAELEVRDVWSAYAHNQAPTETIDRLARAILACRVADNSRGATHFYSPQSMPKEGDDTEGFDVGGGLEQTEGLSERNHRPSWTHRFPRVPIRGVVPKRFKFHRQPGTGPVR